MATPRHSRPSQSTAEDLGKPPVLVVVAVMLAIIVFGLVVLVYEL